MSENYFYSSLTGQEIEDTLVGAVRFNASQNLTTIEQATARQNIGAGEMDVGLVILGFFETLQDLIDSLQTLPKSGDAYGIGETDDYDIYIYDGVHDEWVNYGHLDSGSGIINDGAIAVDSTWSSNKISGDLSTKQAEITAVGMLKGSGSSVSAATKGTDYGALSFTVTLTSAGWSSNVQTISNANVLASGYAYIVSPASTSFAAYGEAGIYADDVSTDTVMVFHCGTAPTTDLTVNIVRMVSA